MHWIRSFRILIVLIIMMSIGIVMIYADSSDGNNFRTSEKNFETPEAAIQYFTRRLASNDIMDVFEACAINEGDKFDFIAFCRYLNAMTLHQSQAPSQSAVFAQINCIIRMSRLAQQNKIMLYSLLTNEILDGIAIEAPGDEWIETFVKNVDSRRLSDLKVIKIKLPVSTDILNSERAKINSVIQANPDGADETGERTVLYKLGDAYYWGGMRLLRYGKYWRIDSLNSSYANTSSMGNLRRITPEEFDTIGGE